MFRLALLVFVVLAVVAIKYLPWWALIIAAVAGLLSLKFLLGYLFTLPFKAKGKVLRGAAVELHAVAPAPPPVKITSEDGGDSEDDDAGDNPEPREHYNVEVTITPKAPSGGFSHWEPGELILAHPDAKANDISGDDDDVGEVLDYEIYRDGKYTKDEEYKVPGPQRLKMLVGVKPGTQRFKFRYYFELLGDVKVK